MHLLFFWFFSVLVTLEILVTFGYEMDHIFAYIFIFFSCNHFIFLFFHFVVLGQSNITQIFHLSAVLSFLLVYVDKLGMKERKLIFSQILYIVCC